MKANYKWIKAGYKFYSTRGVEVPSIPPNAYEEFVADTQLISPTTPKAKVELCKVSAISGQQTKYPYNPQNSIVRFEFLELVVRLARAKYLETN